MNNMERDSTPNVRSALYGLLRFGLKTSLFLLCRKEVVELLTVAADTLGPTTSLQLVVHVAEAAELLTQGVASGGTSVNTMLLASHHILHISYNNAREVLPAVEVFSPGTIE